VFYLSRARMGRLMWQEGHSHERRTSMNLLSARARGTEKKFSIKVKYSAFTIRNLNPYESKVFYEFLPNNWFVNPNLFIKPVHVRYLYLYLVPVPIPSFVFPRVPSRNEARGSGVPWRMASGGGGAAEATQIPPPQNLKSTELLFQRDHTISRRSTLFSWISGGHVFLQLFLQNATLDEFLQP
jgi:hypothetical protein